MIDYTEIHFAGTHEPVIPAARKRFEFKMGEGRGFGVTLNRFNHVAWSGFGEKWSKPGGSTIDQERCIGILASKVIDDVDGLVDQHGAVLVADLEIKKWLLREIGAFFLFVLVNGQDMEAFRKKDDSGLASSTTGELPAPSGSTPTVAA